MLTKRHRLTQTQVNRRIAPALGWALVLVCVGPCPACLTAEEAAAEVVDLSLMVAPEYPCNWPAGWPPFLMNQYLKIGPLSGVNGDVLVIDGNTGTQLDVPPHSVPSPETNLPNAGPHGRMFTDKVPAWQFCGEACVIDCQDLVDSKTLGRSELIKKDRVIAWEKEHRPLRPGDAVLFFSGYTNKYYQPLPEGRRFLAEPLEVKTPAWPDPDPGCMEYLASRKVMTLGTDSPSMGPIPDLAEPTHFAGLKYGMVWTESATDLDKLPTTGAFYCMLGPKHADGLYSECRCLAVVGDPLARRLIDSAREQRVVDLSVVLSTEFPVTWPGPGVGNHRQPYLTVPLFFAANLGTYHVTHIIDSHAGTHLVPPAYALPPKEFDDANYAPDVRAWLTRFEKKFGRRGTSDVTTEKVPLSQACGWARVVDVKHRIGTTERKNWPRSPEITVADLKRYEEEHGELKPGEIVVFHSGYTDTYFKSLPEGTAFMADPLAGKREGWPALGPEAVVYLAEKGIRCVATDGPTLGGCDPERAMTTYWALGSKGMVAVEFLKGVGKLPEEAYFIFAPVKIRGCHGGPGRAIALY
ncbi:MAG TPA: cyclase family protein [Pirellulales bacterium]|nr:cyclase family protein [Pirellulales bacterium]